MSAQEYAHHRHRPTLTVISGFFTIVGVVLLALFAIRQPSVVAFGLLSLGLGVLVLVLISRRYTVRLQDRIIRLEMHGRLARIGREGEFQQLTMPQIVALRFAPDEELAALCDRAVAERLSPDQIKRGIINWQPDLHRT